MTKRTRTAWVALALAAALAALQAARLAWLERQGTAAEARAAKDAVAPPVEAPALAPLESAPAAEPDGEPRAPAAADETRSLALGASRELDPHDPIEFEILFRCPDACGDVSPDAALLGLMEPTHAWLGRAERWRVGRPGRYVLWWGGWPFVDGRRVIGVERGMTEPIVVDVAVGSGIRARIVDATTGRPLRGADPVLTCEDRDGELHVSTLYPDGELCCYAPEGTVAWRLEIFDDVHWPLATGDLPLEGRVVDLGDLALEPARLCPIEVRVTDALDGQPVAVALVRTVPETVTLDDLWGIGYRGDPGWSEREQPLHRDVEGWTTDGVARLRVFDLPGAIRVAVAREGYRTWLSEPFVPLPEPGVRSFDVRLVPRAGAIDVRARGPADWSGATITMAIRGDTSRHRATIADEDGVALLTFDRVDAGSYWITVWDPREEKLELALEPVELQDGERLLVDLDCGGGEDGIVLRGAVAAPEGIAANAITVTVRPSDDARYRSALVKDGRFEVAGVRPGTNLVVIEVTNVWDVVVMHWLVVTATDDTDIGTIDLGRTRVRGTVEGVPSDEPVVIQRIEPPRLRALCYPDAEGRFDLYGLPPGTYQAGFLDESEELHSVQPLVVPSSGTVRLQLRRER